MSKWFSELNTSKPLADAWQSLKKELPMDALMQSWTGEVGLFLSVNSTQFRANNFGRTELGRPSLMLVLGVKDGALEKVLGEQLKDLQEPARTADINRKKVPLRVYEKLELPEEISGLNWVPSVCQSANYLVLSFSFSDVAASSALNRHVAAPAGIMGGTGDWAALLGQNAGSMSVPKANLIFYLAPGFRTELAKWKQLKLWEDVPSGLASALTSLAGSKEDKGLLATVQVRNNGVLFKGHVMGQTSKLTFTQMKNATRVFVAELIPQLAKITHGKWSKLDLPTKTAPAPTPAPETPESSGN